MALRWREPIRLHRALAKVGYVESPVPTPNRPTTIVVGVSALLLLVGSHWAGTGPLGVGLVGLALTMLVTLLFPWLLRFTHRSILITPEGITVFGSTATSFAGAQRHSIESIRSVCLDQIDVRGTRCPAIVFDLHSGALVAVGLRKDETPAEIRQRMQEWGYPFTESSAG